MLALILTIYKFKNQKEFLILWSNGISKLKIINLFFIISIFVIILNLILSIFITPHTLNYSRIILKSSDLNQVGAAIKKNDFTDTFKNVTFFTENKNDKGEFENIFIRDESNSLTGLLSDKNAKDKTIIAKKGYIDKNNLILFDGVIHSFDGNEITSLKYQKTQIAINQLTNRTIQQPKLRETKTITLINCLITSSANLLNCPLKGLKNEVIETLSRRVSMPFYILVVTLISCFFLFSKKEKEESNLKSFLVFILSFFVIIISEIFVRFSGKSEFNAIGYFLSPILFCPIIYFLLIYRSTKEKLNQ